MYNMSLFFSFYSHSFFSFHPYKNFLGGNCFYFQLSEKEAKA